MKFQKLAKESLATIPLALVLFILWIVFTGKLNWHHLVLGAVTCLLLSAFSSYLLRGRLDPHLDARFTVRFPLFSAILFWEIIKANWDVMKRILAPSFPISPQIVDFETYLESDIARTVLANSITLTPGTVTVDIQGSRFFIHCLHDDFTDDPGSGKLQRMTAWLFSEGPPEMRSLK